MKTRSLGLLFAGLLAGPMAANANYVWDESAWGDLSNNAPGANFGTLSPTIDIIGRVGALLDATDHFYFKAPGQWRLDAVTLSGQPMLAALYSCSNDLCGTRTYVGGRNYYGPGGGDDEGGASGVFPQPMNAGSYAFIFQPVAGGGESIYEMRISEVSAVPLPAAAWLLISGLAGLGALGRRKTA